jgi:hypothetical protein
MMAGFQAFIFVALVFGIWAVGPMLVGMTAIAFAIWFVRKVIILERNHDRHDGDDEGTDLSGLVGTESIIRDRKRQADVRERRSHE